MADARDLRARARALGSIEGEDDPLLGFANLFDVAMVLVVALIVTMEIYLRVPALLDAEQDVTVVVQSPSGGMEIVTREAEVLTRYRVSQDQARGEGVRLGTAYRLESGEVVYVPEAEGTPGESAGPATSDHSVGGKVTKSSPAPVMSE
ncbi:DUF2149 domain-containing protein [Nannocystaceae bacterium ST9]